MTTPTASHLDEWRIFSVRYGVHRPDDQVWADKHPWGSRHRSGVVHDTVPDRRRCDCPGTLYPSPRVISCVQAATQEDLLCDECRAWCICSEGDGRLRLIAEVARERRA